MFRARIKNPILKGFYPDPSICRVGNDFWLVTSTFSYFPGIPIFHSKDLSNWKQVGNVLDRAEQLDLNGQGISRGLFAPTIRYHKGRFYVVCTNVGGKGNFVVTAKNPTGPWSNPVWLDAPGIDPSLFFDTDGSAWYIGTRPAPEGPSYDGNWEAWAQPFDTEKLCLFGESVGLWRGALRDCIWPEAPHIYKVGSWYYLTIAEGGTGLDHAVSVARSSSITGPWIGKRSNPILTHRNLGSRAQITNVGHGDLFDDCEGNWWMVCLASRPRPSLDGTGRVSNLGRETFIVPIHWEEEWPFASAKTGHIEDCYEGLNLDLSAAQESFGESIIEYFDNEKLPPYFLFLRTPVEGSWTLNPIKGTLDLSCQAADLSSNDPVSFVGVRQCHFNWRLSARVSLKSSHQGDSAGLAILQSETFQYRFEIFASKENGTADKLRIVKVAGKAAEILFEGPLDESWGTTPVLSVSQINQSLSFFVGKTKINLTRIPLEADASILSTEIAGGFVGTTLGMYASGNGASCYGDSYCCGSGIFSQFEYHPLES